MAGTYTVIVTDSVGCQGVNSIVITEPTELVVLSQNLPNGTLQAAYAYDLLATGGMPPYTWSPVGEVLPGISLSASGMISGTPLVEGTHPFNVTVTDSSGCTKTQLLSITICPAIMVTANSTPVSYEGASDGTITLSVVGGRAPFSYFWTGPSDFTTTQYVSTLDNTLEDVLTGLISGVYTVTVIDANGCQDTIAVLVSTTGCPTITIIPEVTNVSCHGLSDGSISLVIDGGTAPYTFDWF